MGLETTARLLMEQVQDLPAMEARKRIQMMMDKHQTLDVYLLNEPLFISWVEKHADEILGHKYGD